MIESAQRSADWRTDIIRFATDKTGINEQRVAAVIDTCAAEVPIGRELIQDLLKPGIRVLEVGAGIGLLAQDLLREGVNVRGLEPGANGFSDSARIGAAVREFSGTDLKVIDKEASGLTPETDGEFDLIFSVNVLEHMPDLERNLAGMLAVLAPDGVMIHTCPNYHVPYEPHYGLPLVPGFPQAVTYLKPRLRDEELWRSLNFITASRVERFARNAGLDIDFAPGTMHETIQRIDYDPQFSQRHSGTATRIYGTLKSLGLIGALRYLPPALATPMRFSYRRSQRMGQ